MRGHRDPRQGSAAGDRDATSRAPMSGGPRTSSPSCAAARGQPATGVPYPRCDPGPAGLRLPADTRAAAALPVGVRLEFTGDCEAVEIEYRTRDARARAIAAPARARASRSSAAAKRIADAEAALGRRARVRLAGRRRPRAGDRLPARGHAPAACSRCARRAARSRRLRARPRWLCYGDSIAEGWCASEPAGAWPHVVAREQRPRRREPRLRRRRARRDRVRGGAGARCPRT